MPAYVSFTDQTLTWTPQASEVATGGTFILRVTDPSGSYTEQEFTVPVNSGAVPANDAPIIDSIPTGPAIVDEQYAYEVQAHDPNGDILVYSVDANAQAAGVSIDSQTGLLVWTPGSATTISITITASDQHSINLGTATQTFILDTVLPSVPGADRTPEFTSKPAGPAYLSSIWSYQLNATDVEDSDTTLTYSLISPTSDSSVVLDPVTHVLTWTTPASSDSKDIVVRVTDSFGNYAEQEFSISADVTAPVDQPPVIRSVPSKTVRLNNIYT